MSNYIIKSHETFYSGVLFRSRLEARWAAFFDLAGFEWEYEPYDLHGWTPDFLIRFPCYRSECTEGHKILVEVKPYESIKQFEGHPCLDYQYGQDVNDSREWNDPEIKKIPADASAAFGNNPDVTQFHIGCGDSGGERSITDYVNNAWDLWCNAGNITRWKPKRRNLSPPILPPKPESVTLRTWYL